MKVLKFGGTSVGSPERMNQVKSLITRDEEPCIVVLSAVAGTTNSLVEIDQALKATNKSKAQDLITALRKKYDAFIGELFETSSSAEHGKKILEEHFRHMADLTEKPYQLSVEKIVLAQGELLSTKLFSEFLREKGISNELLPALSFMSIDDYKEPEMDKISDRLRSILAQFPKQSLFVTQGYICMNHEGEIDNLRRGGSDYTATIIAAAIEAEEAQIWTDIDGMHNNDPRVVEKTYPIHSLSFDEAAELAYFGAKILHPLSIFPAQRYNIPVKLLSTLSPDARGTYITAQSEQGMITAVAAKDHITAVKIKSHRMLMAYGFLTKVFQVFEKYRTPIDMITTSEVAVSLTIDDSGALNQITEELNEYGTVEIDQNQTIICIVGNFVAQNKGVVTKVFDALERIPIRMISYGGSRHNISLLINMEDKNTALRLLNRELFNL